VLQPGGAALAAALSQPQSTQDTKRELAERQRKREREAERERERERERETWPAVLSSADAGASLVMPEVVWTEVWSLRDEVDAQDRVGTWLPGR
jgi:anti-sigma factor RsiW